MNAHPLQHTCVDTALPTMRLVTGKKPSMDEIYPRLLDAILEQRIQPNSRFTELSLAQSLGASRSVIRRVLARLAEQRIVILQPNIGSHVATPDALQVQHMLEARRLMEVTVARLACAHAQPVQVRQLREQVANHHACIERGQRGAAIRLGGEFHLQLADMAGNKPLAQFLNRLVPLTSLIVAQHQLQGYCDFACHDHREMVDALAARDADEAATLMSRHLDYLKQQLAWDTKNKPSIHT
ncbi:GntR family transcriptional regulator [Pseudomonas orientalis]|uniref:GntR family transcriptional regulator n=1 Tax=Pseudomonas orientalis TaxID=76758 RepID=UPI000F589414|nr:GntR family transcriptional regulator [Pseudomonas orientalis]AZE88995.1 Transcriptional regulator, GntR family [Pseudomonas orientalis]